jgi:hypothetical protein
LLHRVIQDEPVIVVHDLGLAPELDRPPQPSLGDRASITVVQADPPRRLVGGDPGDALSGLCHDLPRRIQQSGQLVDRAGQPHVGFGIQRLRRLARVGEGMGDAVVVRGFVVAIARQHTLLCVDAAHFHCCNRREA